MLFDAIYFVHWRWEPCDRILSARRTTAFGQSPISPRFPSTSRRTTIRPSRTSSLGTYSNQVTGFPNLRPDVCATLLCIRALGPDEALKEHAFTASGDPDKWKRERGRRPILNPNAIAQAMGTDRSTVHRNLREARIILRSAFNADGKLFLSH